MLGDTKLAGLIGLTGLVLTLVGVVIAFLSWRGDENERSAKTGPAVASAPPAASVPATASSPTATEGGARPAKASSPTTADGGARAEGTPKATTKAAETAAPALSYRLAATPLDARTVKIGTDPSGRATPGETYWFMVEVNWGNGNTDYYPRRRLGARAETFDISIPPDAQTDFVRTGRVYALDKTQSAAAEVRLARQNSTTSEDDFFAEPTGRAVSNGERLPF